jgi:hypothetical protein
MWKSALHNVNVFILLIFIFIMNLKGAYILCRDLTSNNLSGSIGGLLLSYKTSNYM